MQIRQARIEDAGGISSLYNQFVRETLISFETELVCKGQMAERIADKLLNFDWLVAVEGGQLLGYGYYGQFRARAAYDGTIESSIYMAAEATGRGLATELYSAVLQSARANAGLDRRLA